MYKGSVRFMYSDRTSRTLWQYFIEFKLSYGWAE